ncbi:hypothetical protein E2C01_081994 [Portunus trituberculatus]|uniref:Uncharacterized protein n=1 Tax=Portunus trituberculatus TaxID=210409 RepID=A0A5B7INT6_PORTR|nr:hypothetical protein [Portunus trituberculatus]
MATVYHNPYAVGHPGRRLDQKSQRQPQPQCRAQDAASLEGRDEHECAGPDESVAEWRGGFWGRGGGEEGGRERGREAGRVCMRTEAPSRASNWVREASVCYTRQAVPL